MCHAADEILAASVVPAVRRPSHALFMCCCYCLLALLFGLGLWIAPLCPPSALHHQTLCCIECGLLMSETSRQASWCALTAYFGALCRDFGSIWRDGCNTKHIGAFERMSKTTILKKRAFKARSAGT